MRIAARAFGRLEDALAVVGGAALVIMMVLGFFDVVGRYLLNAPITGVREIAGNYLMVAVVWLGLARTQRDEAHIRLDLLFRGWHPDRLARLDQATAVVALIPIAVIADRAWRALIASWGESTSGSVPIWPGISWFLVALGTSVLALRLALRALGVRDVPRGDASPIVVSE